MQVYIENATAQWYIDRRMEVKRVVLIFFKEETQDVKTVKCRTSFHILFNYHVLI